MAKKGSNITKRIGANLLAVLLFSVAIIVFALLNFVTGVAFDNSYEVTATLTDASGVLPRQEVTVLGRAVGTVDSAELNDEGTVDLTFSVQPQFAVPQDAVIDIMRRSPIGEQAIEITPANPDNPEADGVASGWEPIDPDGDDNEINVVMEPDTTSVEELLTNTVELFEDVDIDNLAIVIEELGATFEGRVSVIRELNEVSIDVGRTILDGQGEIRRVLSESRPLLADLDAHADDLQRLFQNATELNNVLAANRGNLEQVLDRAPTLLYETQSLIHNTAPNLQCIMDDLIATNRMLLGPSTADGVPAGRYDTKLDEFQMAIDKHRFFFHLGIPLLAAEDPDTGMPWARVRFLLDHASSGEIYPELRPTPGTRPGAACVTEEWGTGVNAVRQPGVAPADPGGPGILYASLVTENPPAPLPPLSSFFDGSAGAGGDGSGSGFPLPATGGGLALFAIAAAAGASMYRRRRT